MNIFEAMQYRSRSAYCVCQLVTAAMVPVLVSIKIIICLLLERRRSMRHNNVNVFWHRNSAYIEPVFFAFVRKSIAVEFWCVWACVDRERSPILE
jgi:hypothetical protein